MKKVSAFLLVAIPFAHVSGEDLSIIPAPGDSGTGLLFYASLDRERRAEISQGSDIPSVARYARQNRTADGGEFVPGVFGKALTGRGGPRGSGDFDALGNYLPERGTMAFHIRQNGMVYGFEPLWVKTVDPYYWFIYQRISNKNNSLSAWFPDEVYRPTVIYTRKKMVENQWLHMAVAWDQAYGFRYYLDGAEVASNWGKASWTSRGVDPDLFAMVHSNGVAYDEFYVFDFVLSAQEIQALAKKNKRPDSSSREDLPTGERWKRNRLQELSWSKDDEAMLPLHLDKVGLEANAIRQVTPLNARAVMKGANYVFDGKLGSGWPPLYNYQFAKGNGLHIELGEPYDYVQIEGYFRGSVAGEKSLLQDEARPLIAIASDQFMHRWNLKEPRGKGWLSFFKKEMEDKGDLPDKELVTLSRVCETGFFRTGTHRLDDSEAQRFYIGPANLKDGRKAFGVEFTGRFGPGDRASLSSRKTPLERATAQAIPGLRYHHLFLPSGRDELPLTGLHFRWWLRSSSASNSFRIEMRDPALPGRRTLAVDFRMDGVQQGKDQLLDLTIDLSDRLLPSNRQVWLTFCFKEDVQLVLASGQKQSFTELLTGSKQGVLKEYLRDELSFVRSRFSWLSEARPWGAHREPEKEMVGFNRYARELFLPLARLWQLKGDDPKVRALWIWTHKFYQDKSPVEPKPVSGCENAPRWALLQRELLQGCRDVVHWWIENRQAPNGEFGDAWGDDTDLIQNFPKLALIGDPDGRIREAARKVADGVYEAGLIERGINARLMDYLHAYEEGVNAQPVMGLIDYGNPHFIERMMEAAHTVDTFLTTKDPKGRRRFRSAYYGAGEVRDKGKYGYDHPSNALFCHPALFLSYYSRHPRALRFLQEWIDGWLDIYAEHADLKDYRVPKATLLDGTILSWDRKVRGYGYIDVYAALHQMTGEERYRSLLPWWARPGTSFFLGGHYLPALEFLDREKHKQQLVKWAELSDLSKPGNDSMGLAARHRYMKWEVTGDEAAAYEALDACIRKLRLTYDAHTWGEPINDRIWLPDHPAIMMTQGEMSHERNQLWPRHYVSYEGFTDFAAWVREKSDTHLKVWLYSFSDRAERGKVRAWRAPLGTYSIQFGPDENADEQADEGAAKSQELHRYAAIPIHLPSRKLCVLQVDLKGPVDNSYWKRPDLAIGKRDIQPTKDGGWSVTVHNLGNVSVEGVKVEMLDAKGNTIQERTIQTIESPTDLKPRAALVTFAKKGGDSFEIRVKAAGGVKELYSHNNQVVVGP